MRPQVAEANWDALRCDFRRYNLSALHAWQWARGDLSGLAQLQHATVGALADGCAAQPERLRALKTIRMIGVYPR